MKKTILVLIGFLMLNACIPLRIAPTIKDYKLTEGKRFKRTLPEKTTFVFEDPKDAGAFYDYVNTKFNLGDYYVDVEVPFSVAEEQYFFSFYEVEIPTKTINLVPLILDAALTQNTCGQNVVFEEFYTSRKGNWYIAIEVFNTTEKDCLSENSISRELVLPYLRSLKKEYLSTHNYNEVVFKN